MYIQKAQFSHAARRSKGVRREKKKGDISEAWCGGFLDQIPFFYFSIFLSRRALVTERNLSVDAKRGLIMHQAHFGNFLALLACFRGISVYVKEAARMFLWPRIGSFCLFPPIEVHLFPGTNDREFEHTCSVFWMCRHGASLFFFHKVWISWWSILPLNLY